MLATKPPTAVAELMELLEVFSQGDLSVAMGKTAESISRMKKSPNMRRSTERLIDDFWYATHLAYQRFDGPEPVRFFVLSRQPALDGKTPAEVIVDGGVEQVIACIKQQGEIEEAVEMPRVGETSKQPTEHGTRLAAMSSRPLSRLRDDFGISHTISAVSEERAGRYELQSEESPAPRPRRGTTSGITYSEPAF